MKLKNKLELGSTLKVGALPTASTSNYSVLFENGGLVSKRTVGNIINYNSSDFISGISNSFPSIFNYNTSTTATDPSLVVSFKNQLAGTVLAAPATLNGTPSFRKLIDSDLSETSIFSQLGNYVPYTGATQNVDLGENLIITRTEDPDAYFKVLKFGIFAEDPTALGMQVETATPLTGFYNSPYIFDISGSLSGGNDFVTFNAPNEGGMAFRHRNDYFDQLTYKNGRLTLGERWDYVNSTHKLRVKGNGIFTSTLQSTGFIRTGSNNNYVLLGGGGHKLVSDFALSTDIPDVSNFLSKNISNTVTQDFEITNGSAKLKLGNYVAIVGEVAGESGIELGSDDGFAVSYYMSGGENFEATISGIQGNVGNKNWAFNVGSGYSRMLMPETGSTERVLALGAKLGSNTYYANTQGIVELPEYPSVSGFVPYTGANQPVNLNTQGFRIGGDFEKTSTTFEKSYLVNSITGSTHFTRLTDVASFSRGNDSTTQTDCIVITLPIRTTTRWVMEVDAFTNSVGDIFGGTPTKLIIGAYATSNSTRSVTVISGADNVKSVSFCRDTNNNTVIIIRPKDGAVTTFGYGKVNISNFYHSVIYNSDLADKSNYKVEAVLESSLTGLTTNGTITNAQFTRDNYLWNKGDFTQTNVDNWNTAFGWTLDENNYVGIHKPMLNNNLDEEFSGHTRWIVGTPKENGVNVTTNGRGFVLGHQANSAGLYGTQFIFSDIDDFVFRNKVNGTVHPWRKVWHTGNFNPAQYVLQSDLNTQLGNYATKAGVNNFTNTNTFLESPYIPAGTLDGHAVNLGQVNSLIAGISAPTLQQVLNSGNEAIGSHVYIKSSGNQGSTYFSEYTRPSSGGWARNGFTFRVYASDGTTEEKRVSIGATGGYAFIGPTYNTGTSIRWYDGDNEGVLRINTRRIPLSVNGTFADASGNISVTDTTYSAGTGLSLTGTTFGQTITTSGTGSFVTGITQTTNGFQVNLGTPPNTTYSAGTLALLQAGTNTTNRVWSAKVIADYVTSMIPTSTDSILSYSSANGIIVTDWNSFALSEYAMSLGYGSVTSGNYATSVGGLLSTTGFGSTNQGYSNSITKPLGYSLGAYNSVRATLSGVFGIGLINRNDGAFVVGRYNSELPIVPYDTTLPHTQAVFAIGAGRDETDRFTALTVYGDGRADYAEGYDDSTWTNNTLVTKKWVLDNVSGGGSGASGLAGYRNVNSSATFDLSSEYSGAVAENVYHIMTSGTVTFIGGNAVFTDGYKITIMTYSTGADIVLDNGQEVKFIRSSGSQVTYLDKPNRSVTFIYDKEYASFRVYHVSELLV